MSAAAKGRKQQKQQDASAEDERPSLGRPAQREVKTNIPSKSTEHQTAQTNPISPQTPTFDAAQYHATLQGTPAATFARTASAYASSPSVGGLRNPDIIDCILVDHAQILTLFSHFFQAAESSAVNIMELVCGAIVLELRLHSQAEIQVLYPVFAQRLGGEGMALTQRALAEHAMLERSLTEILRLRRPADSQLLITRVKQLEIETMTHLAEEESMILPRMAAACSPQELGTLGLSFRTAKQMAPLMPQTEATIAALGGMAQPQATRNKE